MRVAGLDQEVESHGAIPCVLTTQITHGKLLIRSSVPFVATFEKLSTKNIT